MSGQVEIRSQVKLQLIVISKSLLLLCTACIAYYRGIGTGLVDPGTAGSKIHVAASREPTINNKHEIQD